MARGSFQIGSNAWTPANGSVKIKYVSAADNNQVKADGKDDARQTFRGREVRRITLELIWKEDHDPNVPGAPGPIDLAAIEFLAAISPAGPSAGKPQAWTEDDQGIHNVNNVTVDKIETTRTPGIGSASAVISLSSWVKPAVKPAVTATPPAPQPWSPTDASGRASATFTRRTLPGFTQTPVTVKP